MELILIENINDQDWDNLIENYETKSLFHQSAWLKFLEETQKAQILKFKVCENDRIVGYFVGILEKRGPFKIFSSPRPGCNTPHMGPIMNKNFDQQEFIHALEKYCKFQKIDQLELSNPILRPEILQTCGFRYREGATYIVELPSNEELMWRNLKSECRTAIRKAQKNNLMVEDTNNSLIIDEYYSKLLEVFSQQGLVPTYSYNRPKVLFDCLKKIDLLFALRVKYGNRVIATGLFLHDDRCIYFFGGASRQEFHCLRPNDLLHWTAMTMAAKKGILKYDMGGRGTFKPKFGGKLTPTYHWYKSYNPLAGLARTLYQYKFKILQKIKGLKYKIT